MRLRRSQGFTLIEVLVAFVIAASALALLFRIQSGATATVIRAQDYAFVAELSESLIAEFDGTETEPAFTRSGVAAHRFRWRVTSRSLNAGSSAPPVKSPDGRDPFRLRRMTVKVTWSRQGRDRSFEVQAVRPVLDPAMAP